MKKVDVVFINVKHHVTTTNVPRAEQTTDINLKVVMKRYWYDNKAKLISVVSRR